MQINFSTSSHTSITANDKSNLGNDQPNMRVCVYVQTVNSVRNFGGDGESVSPSKENAWIVQSGKTNGLDGADGQNPLGFHPV